MKLRRFFLTIFSVFLVGFVVFGAGVSTVKARSIPEVETYQNATDDPTAVNLENLSRVLGNSLSSYTYEGLMGTDGENGTVGAIPATFKAITYLYTPPASSEIYVADLLRNGFNIGVAQPAYAQGVGGLGFSALEPILGAWKQFRNVAYFFFIMITLIIGFMIMMRQKVGAQAAVTAQQAIPSIIVALITVTFSYAIAGFLIDMMYLIMFFFVGLFGMENHDYINKDILNIGFSLVTGDGGVFSTSFSAVSNFVTEIFESDNAIVEGIGTGAGILTGLSFGLIIAFATIFGIISLFFELLKTYVDIILSIVLAPILLMLGALPGSKDVFANWIKGLIGNLIAFPTVLLLLIVYRTIEDNSGGNGGFLPPYLIGRGAPDVILTLVGLSMILTATEFVKQAKKAINPKQGIMSQFGDALGKAIGKGWSGGDLIPGMGWSNTSKLPFGVGRYVGSGKALTQTGASAIVGAGGALQSTPGAIFDTAQYARFQATGGRKGWDEVAPLEPLRNAKRKFDWTSRKIGQQPKKEEKK